jgi:hypothetical protein
VGWDGHDIVIGLKSDVPNRIVAPIHVINLSCCRIVFDCVNAAAAQAGKRSMKAANAGEQIDKSK